MESRNESIPQKHNKFLFGLRIPKLGMVDPKSEAFSKENHKKISLESCDPRDGVESLFPLESEPIQFNDQVKSSPKIWKKRVGEVGIQVTPRKDGVIKAVRYIGTPKDLNQGPRTISHLASVYSSSGELLSRQELLFDGPGWAYSALSNPAALQAGETYYVSTLLYQGDEYYQQKGFFGSLDNQRSLSANKGAKMSFDRVDFIKTNDNLHFVDLLFAAHQNIFPSSIPAVVDVAPERSVVTTMNYGLKFRTTKQGKIYGIKYYHQQGDITTLHTGNIWVDEVDEPIATIHFDTSPEKKGDGWRTTHFQVPLSIVENYDFYVTVNFTVEMNKGRVPGFHASVGDTFGGGYVVMGENKGYYGSSKPVTQDVNGNLFLVDILFNPIIDCIGNENDFIDVPTYFPPEPPVDEPAIDLSSCQTDKQIQTLFGYQAIERGYRGKNYQNNFIQTSPNDNQYGSAFVSTKQGVIKAFKFYKHEQDSTFVPNTRHRNINFFSNPGRIGGPIAEVRGETREGWQYVKSNWYVEREFAFEFTYDVAKNSKYLVQKARDSDTDVYVADSVSGPVPVYTPLPFTNFPNVIDPEQPHTLDFLFLPFQGIFSDDDHNDLLHKRRPNNPPPQSSVHFKPDLNLESGNVVTFSQNGLIYGAKFFKKQHDGTRRLVNIWRHSDGELLFSNGYFFESQSGWQTYDSFYSAFQVEAGVKYVISVNYNADAAFTETSLPFTNGYVTVEGAVYGAEGSYPDQAAPQRVVNLVDVYFVANNLCLGENVVTKST